MPGRSERGEGSAVCAKKGHPRRAYLVETRNETSPPSEQKKPGEGTTGGSAHSQRGRASITGGDWLPSPEVLQPLPDIRAEHGDDGKEDETHSRSEAPPQCSLLPESP